MFRVIEVLLRPFSCPSSRVFLASPLRPLVTQLSFWRCNSLTLGIASHWGSLPSCTWARPPALGPGPREGDYLWLLFLLSLLATGTTLASKEPHCQHEAVIPDDYLMSLPFSWNKTYFMLDQQTNTILSFPVSLCTRSPFEAVPYSWHYAAIWIVATRWTVGSGLESPWTKHLSRVVDNCGHLMFSHICTL